MNKAKNTFLLFSIVLVSFLAGHWLRMPSESESASAGARRILYYHDPMHPAYKSDKPGIAPDCGMQLEPVYSDETSATQAPQPDPASFPPGTVQVGSDKEQLIGVKLAEVQKTPERHELRTLGRVTADEDLIYRVVAGTDGWVRELIPGGTTGSVVQKDQLLALTYSRELLNVEQPYYYSLNVLDGLKANRTDSPQQIATANAQVRTAEDGLRALGMGDIQLQEIAKSRRVSSDLAIRAPVTGLIVARAVYPGLRFEKGTELYRLVDLSRVWVMADLFQNETQHFRPGTSVRVTIPHRQTAFAARVSNVPPQFDPATRTLKVRLDVDNRGFVLRPDMFVDVELPINLPASVVVPADAVLDSGLKKTVFVGRGNGYFEPRQVETGWRLGDRVEIVKGLVPGERIAVSGNFLLDSESRMKFAEAKSQVESGNAEKLAKDPVCGMNVDPSAPNTLKTQWRGKTYSFCSEKCKRDFDGDPQKYVQKSKAGQASNEGRMPPEQRYAAAR